MKKKIILTVFIAFVIFMCIPATEYYDDGGTTKYNAVLWGVTKKHSLTNDSAGNHGYSVGIIIRILCFDVYKDLEFIPEQKGA